MCLCALSYPFISAQCTEYLNTKRKMEKQEFHIYTAVNLHNFFFFVFKTSYTHRIAKNFHCITSSFQSMILLNIIYLSTEYQCVNKYTHTI